MCSINDDEFIPKVDKFTFNGKEFDSLNEMIEYSDKYCSESKCGYFNTITRDCVYHQKRKERNKKMKFKAKCNLYV